MLLSIYIKRITYIVKIRSFFGFYGYSGESKTLNLLLYGYCVICFLFVGSFFRLLFFDQVFYSQSMNTFNPFYLNSIEYIINCASALVSKGKLLNELSSLINLTGSILNVRYLSVSKKMYIFLFFLTVYRLSTYIFLNIKTGYSDNHFLVYLNVFITFSLYIWYTSLILVIDILYHLMKLVKRNLDRKYTSVNVISMRETRSNRKKNIQNSLVVYECLVTFVEDLGHELHIWIITMLLIYFLRCINNFHITLLGIMQKQALSLKDWGPINISVYACVLVSLPIIFFEFARNEVEDIKEFLSNSALVETDKELIVELLRAVEYIKLRPFELRIYRAIPFDMSLILNFMSLVVTYTIIIAQFQS